MTPTESLGANAPAKPASTGKALPAPDPDFYQLVDTLPKDEVAVVKQVRAFMESHVVTRETAGRSVEQLANDENRVIVGLLKLRAAGAGSPAT